MTIYAGLDVSDKTTHVCVVDGAGGLGRARGVKNIPSQDWGSAAKG